ncbi:phospholipid phosphatase 6 [Venturia canescens]|uniref:phospholipid phosphatase 6 n=1 Tax=Venturia canescens TaxID=32260 RepID=UPI001C9D20FC|nr:phospholipid phosphatase 6 [Venturia canescens]
MGKVDEKRNVPSILRRCLAVDAYLTNVFVKNIERFLPLRQLKVHYQVLEYSCHGIIWLAGLLAFIWILNKRDLYQMQVNLMLALVLDILVIAVLKATTRRRRPRENTDPLCMGPDKYSFPSGHASRSAMIVYFFFNLWPVSVVFIPPLLAWTTSICLSRLLMRRHHLLDVAAGVIVGILEGMFIGLIYLEPATCANLISWLSDEKLPGAEYDV